MIIWLFDDYRGHIVYFNIFITLHVIVTFLDIYLDSVLFITCINSYLSSLRVVY